MVQSGYALLEMGDSSQLAIICRNARAAGSPVLRGVVCICIASTWAHLLWLAERTAQLGQAVRMQTGRVLVHLKFVRTSPTVCQRAVDHVQHAHSGLAQELLLTG